jgi:outer membrane murein-binding lipoprotein Lpp
MNRKQLRNQGLAQITIAAVLLAALFLSGCPKDPYTASMAASLDVSNGVSDGISAIGQLKKDNLITQAEVASYVGYLGDIGTLNGTFRTSVKQIHASGATGKAAYISAASTFVTNANNSQLLAALHVDSPAAQAKVQTFMAAIKTALDGIQTAINTAKGSA